MQNSFLFRQKIIDSFARVKEENTILFFMLSDWVYVLLIPESYRYSDYEAKQIAREIQQHILPSKHPHHQFKVLSWQDVVHENQHSQAPFSGWMAAREVQPVFFIDSKFFEHASESLWLAQELKESSRKHQLAARLKAKTAKELRQCCPQSANWRLALESSKSSLKSVAEWVSILRESDWENFGKSLQISLRSKAYAKAWPDALMKNMGPYVWAVESEDQRGLRPLLSETQPAPQELIEHYVHEAKGQLGNRNFESQVFISEDPDFFASAFVGDNIASAAAFPELLLGILRPFNAPIKEARIVSFCEDVILILDPKSPPGLLKDLIEKSGILLKDQSSDGFDALDFDEVLTLPEHPCGKFNWIDIPAPYFDLVEAAEDAKTALPPGRSEYLRGLSYELIQSWDKAVEVFRVAFRYNFSDGDISHALGRALNETGAFEEAISFLKRALDIIPDDPDIANGLGIAHLECGNHAIATEVFERAVAQAPDDSQFLANLGRCYFSSKRFEEAEKVLKEALQYTPNFSEAHSTLAQIRWRLGDVTNARKHARKAFAANPGSQYTQDLLWALTVDDR